MWRLKDYRLGPGEGIAMLDIDGISRIGTLQKKLGLLSQTTRYHHVLLISLPVLSDRHIQGQGT